MSIVNYVYFWFCCKADCFQSRFWDIPSAWWQASTVLVGIASALSLLVAVTALAACCITYVVHTGTARVAGALQLIAGNSHGRKFTQTSTQGLEFIVFPAEVK